MNPRPFAIFLLLIGSLLLVLHLGRADVRGGPEASHAVMMLNDLRAPSTFLSPSPQPAGPPGETPFLYPTALSLWARAGRSEFWLRLPSALCVLATSLVLLRLGWRRSPVGGVAALGGFLLSVPAILAGRIATPDAAAVLFAVLAFGAAVRGGRESHPGLLGLSGVLLGCSFLLRPWLCWPAAMACLFVAGTARGTGRRVSSGRNLGAFLALGLPVAALQLILASLLTPVHLRHWGAVLSPLHTSRDLALAWLGQDSGATLAALAPLAPLAILGALDWGRASSAWPRAALWIWWLSSALLPGGLGSGPSSLMALPAWALLLADGAGTLARWSREELWRYPLSAKLLSAGLAGLFALSWIPALAEPLASFGPPALIRAALALWVGLLALVAGRSASPYLKELATAAATTLLVLPGAARALRAERTADARNYYREVSRELLPQLEATSVDAASFVAPEAGSLSYYSYRRGISWPGPEDPHPWAALENLADGRHARAFLLPRPGLRPPAQSECAPLPAADSVWFAEHKADLTPELEANLHVTLPYRVFVNTAPHPAVLGPDRPAGIPLRKAIIHPPSTRRRYRRL